MQKRLAFTEYIVNFLGPGEYVPDPTEGITDIKELPQPKLIVRHCTRKREPCPICGHLAYRHTQGQRRLRDLGDLDSGHPVDLLVTYSYHYCSRCRKHCSADLSELAPPGSH